MPNVCAFGFASLFGSSYNSTGWLFFLPFWPYPANFFSSHNINYNIICLVHLINTVMVGACIFFCMQKVLLYIKLVAGDILAPTSMKNAANCDT